MDADNFYIVQGGKYEVTLLRRPGDVVHTYRNPGESFGELALLYNCPYATEASNPRVDQQTGSQAGLLLTRLSLTLDRRAATVRCTRGGTLWALDRATFRDVLCGSKVDETQATAAFLGARDLYLLWPSCILTLAFLYTHCGLPGCGVAPLSSYLPCHAMPIPTSHPPLLATAKARCPSSHHSRPSRSRSSRRRCDLGSTYYGDAVLAMVILYLI